MPEKKKFEWETGNRLSDDEVVPLGNVRSKGLPKLGKAPHADPQKRKAETAERLTTEQKIPYKKTVERHREEKPEEFFREESVSGVTGGDEDEAKRLVKQDNKKFKGVNRFGKK